MKFKKIKEEKIGDLGNGWELIQKVYVENNGGKEGIEVKIKKPIRVTVNGDE